MTLKLFWRPKERIVFFLLLSMIMAALPSIGQRIITGKVTDAETKQPLPGATIFMKDDIDKGIVTDTNGAYSLSLQTDSAVLVFSHVGYQMVEKPIAQRTVINVALLTDVTSLNEVVVVGYGSQLKKDITGAVSSVQEKDFNRGNFASPDLLLQGRVAGLQITANSGQPGIAATIKIRGNTVITGSGQPLFVVDGVPLSGSTARPDAIDDFGTSPASNPLNFINPSDIVSMDVLKDASASAIYGSRAAYGVVLITTKKGQAGEPKIDFSLSTGLATIRKKVEILDAAQFRKAIPYYGVNTYNDKGGNSDALNSILRTGKQQNYTLGISGGNASGKYRVSFGYFDQEGILNKSKLKKYNANLSASFKFLESKKLGMDINLVSSQYIEDIPPIRNESSIVGGALVWNPTDSLRKADGSLNIKRGVNNPLAINELYNDNSKTTTILASIAPYYIITDWLEFKILASINNGSGERRTSGNQALNPANPVGTASIYNNENLTGQFTSTLTFHRDISTNLNVTAIAGFEYMKFTSKGSSVGVSGPPSGFGNFGLDYTNYIQYSNSASRLASSFANPLTELQSYFGRTVLNYKSKYLLTGTFRADGSTKFGDNNKYGYFPSFSAAWIISNEGFFKSDLINSVKLRFGWGKTGNQEFPAGAAKALYSFSANGGLGQINNPNPNLKWQSDQQLNVGIDVAILKNKISATFDYFDKITTDLLYPSYPIQPAPQGSVVTWINLDGKIQNSGLEATIHAALIGKPNLSWDFGVNATFIKNNISGLPAPIFTGDVLNSNIQIIQNGLPINSFYTRNYLGIDESNGFAVYQDNGNTYSVSGNPNPTTLLGINSTFKYKKLSLSTNMYGAFGHAIYNSTLNGALNVGHINGGGNIALSEFNSPVKESVANPVTSSSRYVVKGDYLKMGNATLTYTFNNFSKAFKQARIYVTGQNLFSITNYAGFDAEVNSNRNSNGVPSLGIDSQSYPSARTFIVGLNFSL